MRPVPAELVWFVSAETSTYDQALCIAMACEYQLSEALSGYPHEGLWFSERHHEHRWRPFETAMMAMLGQTPLSLLPAPE